MRLLERLLGTVRGEVKVDASLHWVAIGLGIFVTGAIIVVLLIKLL